MSGSGGSTTTVQEKSEPWQPSQPLLREALQGGRSIFEKNKFAPEPYRFPRVADFGEASQASQGMMYNQAMAGAPTIEQGQGVLSNMMSGDYRSDLLDSVKNEALGSAIPAAVAQFSGSGMTNSTQAMDTVGRAATQAVAPIEYGAFEAGQNRAMQAAGMAPQLESAGYLPAQMMGQVGALQDRQSQAQIDAHREFFNEIQGREAANYRNYLDTLLPIAGQGTVGSRSEPGPSTGAQLASAGLTGLGTYGALAGVPALGPYAAIGGIGAGLLGLF